MPLPEAAVYARLSGYADLTALVGTRIRTHGSDARTLATPYVLYQRISAPDYLDIRGNPGAFRLRFQVDCYDPSLMTAGAVAEAVRKAFTGWRGTAGGVFVKGSSPDGAGIWDAEHGAGVNGITLYAWHQDVFLTIDA